MMTSEQFFGLEKDNPHDHIRWGSPPVARKRTPAALNPTDQDSLNAAAGGNLLEKSPQDALTIIENKSKVRNSRTKPIASLVNACDINPSYEIAKLTHAVNQQTSVVTTAMTAMLKQLQANPPPAQFKAVEEICVTCGGAHPYYQCLAVGGNTFPKFKDNIQGYVSAAAGNYNQGNPGYRPQGVANQMRPPGFAQPNVQNNQNRFGQPQGFNRGPHFNQKQPYQATAQSNQNFHLNELEKIKRMNDVSLKAMQNQIDMMNTASTLGSRSLPGNTVANPKGELKAITTRSGIVTDGPVVPTPPKSVTPEEDECVEETYTDPDLAEYTIKVPPPPLQKPKPLIQRHFVLHTRDSPRSNIPELKCKALADLGASINLMPLSVWKKLGLPDLIPTRMTLELANRAICTPDEIARDVFVSVGKFTFPADFVVVDYESDPRVPLILGRPFLRTARALIDVYGEEMILRDGDERLTLNMKHDTARYYKHPYRESANLLNIFNISSEDCLEDSVSNKQSGIPTFLLHKEITSPKVTHEIHDSEGLPLIHLTRCLRSSDELALITYPSDYDDNRTCDIESDLKEIEFLLYQGEDSDLKDSIDKTDLANHDDLFVDPTPEMFTDKHAPDYSFPPRFDVNPNSFEFDAVNFYDDSFDSKGEIIKECELLIDQLDLPCDILPYSEYDSFNSQDFSRDDDLPSPANEDKVFNPGILIHEKSVKIITRVAQAKKLAISYASLVFEDFDPSFYEPIVFKEVPNSMRLLLFSSENEEKVFKPEIYTSEK
nr:reverse transcriptase domain-containing protein [Tanacetum cinerariifolium]